MSFLKLSLFVLFYCIFLGTGFAAINSIDVPSSLMQERAEAMKDSAEAKTLFDAKEINLDKTIAAKELTGSTAKMQNLKESEVPVHFDSVKEKSAEKTSLPRILISLAVVFSLLGGAIFALKNWTKTRSVQNGGVKIRILTQHHLGPKKSLAIVQVAGESILIGITDQNISMLKSLALIDDEIPAGQPNKFDDALYNYEEEAGEIGKHFSLQKESPAVSEPEEFALRGISEIRDVVSRRLKGMRHIE